MRKNYLSLNWWVYRISAINSSITNDVKNIPTIIPIGSMYGTYIMYLKIHHSCTWIYRSSHGSVLGEGNSWGKPDGFCLPGFAANLLHIFYAWKKKTSLKLTVRTWKWMVGIRSFPFGFRPIFRGKLAVSFREGPSTGAPRLPIRNSCLWAPLLQRKTSTDFENGD